LALSGTFVTGFTTIVDPARKWIQLRGGALALESEIWKFRTRVSEYQAEGGSLSLLGRKQADRIAESVFRQSLLLVQERVQQSSGLKETSFYAQPTSTDDIWRSDDWEEQSSAKGRCHCLTRLKRGWAECCYKWGGPSPRDRDGVPLGVGRLSRAHHKHGQYRGGCLKDEPQPGQDSYHFPATPNEYVRWRLVPQLRFYQGRIPQYATRRRVFQVAMLFASVASALLASIEADRWTAIVASVSGALAAWQEFVGMAKKLERYSSVASSLSNVLMYWQSLPEVDQSNLRTVEALVERTESLLGSEHAVWLSDAQQALKLVKESTKEDGKKAQDKSQDSQSKEGQYSGQA